MCKIYFPSFLVDGPYLQIIEEPKQVIDIKKLCFSFTVYLMLVKITTITIITLVSS